METSRLLIAVSACVFGVSLFPCASAYNIIDLGTLGGSDSYGYGINASGQVTGWSDYWSSTARASNPLLAFLVNFFDGEVYFFNKLNEKGVRAVRGGR